MKYIKALPPVVKRLGIIVLSLLLVAGITLAVLFIIRNKSSEVNVFSVSDLKLGYHGFDQSQTAGNVFADKIQSVYVSKTQIVKEIHVSEGDTVKVGDPLLSYDTTLSDLELKRQEIRIGQLELELKQAENYRRKVDTYVVGSYVPPEDTNPYPSWPLCSVRTVDGDGNITAFANETRPLIYLWRYYPDSNDVIPPACTFNSATFAGLLKDVNTACDYYQTKHSEALAKYALSGKEADNPDNPESIAYMGRNPGAPDSYPKTASIVFEQRYKDSYSLTETSGYGSVEGYFQLTITWTDETNYSFIVSDAPAGYNPDDPIDNTPEDTTVYISTWAELNQLKQEAQEKINTLNVDLKKAKYQYSVLEYELNNGVVLSKIDGTVKTLEDIEAVAGTDTPALVVSGGGGYFVSGVLSENELPYMAVGDSVEVMSWESGQSYTATITEISSFPYEGTLDSTYHSSNGNRNSSLYPFTAAIDPEARVKEKENLQIVYSPGGDTDTGFYIENMFIRLENGQHYVYAENAEGLLERRNVVTGGTIWGSYTKVLSGISEEDHIAFPYGKQVKNGAKAKEVSIDVLYNY